MLNAPVLTVFDAITDFLATNPSPEQILAYHFPDDLQARLDELLERNGEDQLTPDERQELFEFIRVDDLMTTIKIKTKLRLKGITPK